MFLPILPGSLTNLFSPFPPGDRAPRNDFYFFFFFIKLKSTCGERRLADDINGSAANQSQSSSDVTFAGVDRKQEVKDGGPYERV